MKKNLYFVSDAHLSFKETEAEQTKRKKLVEFLQFIEKDEESAALYLVGDIFDFWFEWYHLVPKYWFGILHQLKKLTDKGIEVHFITGNHDFYTGSYLHKEVGLTCHDEAAIFEHNGKRFFVAHGDGYAKKDRGYRLLKRIIRNRLSIFLYKTFYPPDLGMQTAKWFSKSSRQLVRIEKTAWAKEYHEFAKTKLEEGFDIVVLGHIHFPMLEKEGPEGKEDEKAYLNCGDWMNRYSYGKYDGESLSLHTWEST